jgi:hypothetical protein
MLADEILGEIRLRLTQDLENGTSIGGREVSLADVLILP